MEDTVGHHAGDDVVDLFGVGYVEMFESTISGEPGANDLMSVGQERRHEMPPDESAGTCDQDLHRG
jgi:hypothetical protein